MNLAGVFESSQFANSYTHTYSESAIRTAGIASGCVARSTRGASKQRRDQINCELQQLRELLPLASEATRERLFQLQVMALTCIWIRKHAFVRADEANSKALAEELRPSLLMNGRNEFVLAATAGEGKMLALGPQFPMDPAMSTEEFLAQGDSLFELIDPRDHWALADALRPGQGAPCAFVCGWRAPKVGGSKRLTDWDGRPCIVEGRLVASSQVFIAICRPLLLRPIDAVDDPSVLCVRLSKELRIVHQCPSAKVHLDPLLGAEEHQTNASLYHLVHPLCVPALSQLHQKLLCPSPRQSNCLYALLNLVSPTSQHSFWAHSVFRFPQESTQIEATLQVLSDLEANAVQKATHWLHNGEENGRAEEAEQFERQQSGQKRLAKQRKQPQRKEKTRKKPFSSSLYWRPPVRMKDAPFVREQPDLNNNSKCNPSAAAAAIGCCSSSLEDTERETDNLLHYQLPSLCDGALPELDDRDLDEFFRQVEQRGEWEERRERERTTVLMRVG